MSNSLEQARAWCKEAHELLDAAPPKPKAKAKDLFAAADDLNAIFANTKGKPGEITDDEWHAATDEVAVARSGRVGDKYSGPLSANPQPQQKSNFTLYETGVDVIVKRLEDSVAARQKAFAELDPSLFQPLPKLKAYTPVGIAELKRSDNPKGKIDQAKALNVKMEAANQFLAANKDVIPFFDKTAGKAHYDNYKQEIPDLDLDAANISVASFEALKNAAIKERDEVKALKEKYADDPDASDDLAMWRKVNKKDNEVKKIAKQFPTILAAARKIAGKREQCNNFEPRVTQALENWDTYTIAQKLDNSEKSEGSVPWFQDKLDRLQAAPLTSQLDESTAIFNVQWNAFCAEVIAGWNAFAASKFRNKNLRGPTGDLALRTWRVEEQLKMGMEHKIGIKKYTVSPSQTAGKSLKASFPMPRGGYMLNAAGDEIAHFIYHLPDLA